MYRFERDSSVLSGELIHYAILDTTSIHDRYSGLPVLLLLPSRSRSQPWTLDSCTRMVVIQGRRWSNLDRSQPLEDQDAALASMPSQLDDHHSSKMKVAKTAN